MWGLIHPRAKAGFGATTLLAVLVLFASAQSASGIGIGESGFYSFGSSGCPKTDHIDPVGVVFQGTHASAKISSEQVALHAGWDEQTSTSTQWLWVLTGNEKYGCRETNYQPVSDGDIPPSSRYHVRLWYVPQEDGTTRRTVGTPHHEDWVWTCPGHAVDANGSNGSGFDQGRHALKNAFVDGGHSVQSEYWGNTANFKQCDGDYAGSDGWGIRISLNHASG